MKILMITPWYPDRGTPNSGIFIQHQALALSQEHQVLVISSKVDYSRGSFFHYSIEGTQFHKVRECRLLIRQSLPFYNQINQLYITCLVSWRIAKNFRPDIIHASIGYPGAVCGFVVSRLLRIPFVFTEHTRVKNNFRSFFHRITTKFAIKQAAAVMAVSERLANEIRAITRREVKIVPNIVDVRKFAHVTRRTTVDSAIVHIGFLGGMNTPVKGLDILLKSLSSIQRPFILHVGGTGKLEAEYRTLASKLGLENKCRFYGFISPELLAGFMERIDFMVCSSRYETFCIALVEAMASGKPVVSTRCGGPEDFINDENGMLCENENPEALGKAIMDMMSKYRSYAETDLKNFAARFRPENIRQMLVDTYKEAIQNTHR